MDIKLAYSWIKEYVQTNFSASEFAKAVSLGGPSIERWDFNEAVGDDVLSIEVTANRADMASVIGIAREASAILKVPFLFKEPYVVISPKELLPLKVSIQSPKLCKRYQSIVIDGVQVKDSPKFIQDRLIAAGMNVHNNIVDITNYVLLEYGQPTHAFDYALLKGNTLLIRNAHKGEKFVSLDNTEYELDDEMLVIADAEEPVALAGIKGGLPTGISEKTKTVVIEAANFEPASVRQTWRKLDLRTDASSLFEKGLNIGLTSPALMRVIELILAYAGGEVKSPIIDEKNIAIETRVIHFALHEVQRLLGMAISDDEIIACLESLDFSCKKMGSSLDVSVPYHRMSDIEFDYDLVEEVARIYGYHRIPSELPAGEIPRVRISDDLVWEERAKDMLAGIGLTEILAYTMISEKHLESMNIDKENVLEVANPLSEEFMYLRNELTSTMLQVASENEEYEDVLKLFSIDIVYMKKGEKDLPVEQMNFCMLINGVDGEDAFFELKGLWEHILENIGISLARVEYNKKDRFEFMDGAGAEMSIEGVSLGKIGIINQRSANMFGAKKKVAILEINFEALVQYAQQAVKAFTPIPKYPAVTRDLAFLVDESLSWKDVHSLVSKNAAELFASCELFDVYKGKGVEKEKKSIAFHIKLQSPDKTLEDKDIALVIASVVQGMKDSFGAKERI